MTGGTYPPAVLRSPSCWPLWVVLVAGCHERSPETPSAPAEPIASPPAPLAAPPPPALAGCPLGVEDLPAEPHHDPDDPRLRAPVVLVAHKSARRLIFFAHGEAQGCWPMGLGFDPRGHKQHEGDGRTPEGWYRTSDKPWSDFPGAIAVHYPNRDDATTAWRAGRLPPPILDQVLDSLAGDLLPPQHTPLGGEILIHGGGSEQDWTLGCMALADEDLAQLRAIMPTDQRASLLVLP